MEITYDEIKRTPYEEISLNYEYIKDISSGSFGSVIKAINKNTKEEVAIKIINKLSDKIDICKIKEEINILKRLNHKNILKYYEYIETNGNIYIIMEELKGGTLKDWIKKNKNENINEEKISLIIKNILSAISYLHNMNMCHRDIKPENIMFKNNYDINSIKLIDFGLSVKNFYDYGEQTYCGTFIYMAPEQLENNFYSKLIDIWSIGIILYQLLNKGQHPFFIKGITKRKNYLQNIKKSKLKCNFNVSKMGEDLLKKMLEIEPTIRISAKNALKHPWITRNLLDPIPLNLYQQINKYKILKKFREEFYIVLFINFCRKKSFNKYLNDDYINKIYEENIIGKKSYFNKRLNEFKINFEEKNIKEKNNNEEIISTSLNKVKENVNISSIKTTTNESNNNNNTEKINSINHSISTKKLFINKIFNSSELQGGPLDFSKKFFSIKKDKSFISLKKFNNQNCLPLILNNSINKEKSNNEKLYLLKKNGEKNIIKNYISPYKMYQKKITVRKNFRNSSFNNIRISKYTGNIDNEKLKFCEMKIIKKNLDLTPVNFRKILSQQRNYY